MSENNLSVYTHSGREVRIKKAVFFADVYDADGTLLMENAMGFCDCANDVCGLGIANPSALAAKFLESNSASESASEST